MPAWVGKPFTVGHLVFCAMDLDRDLFWFGDEENGWRRVGTVDLNHGWMVARIDDAPCSFLKVAHGTPTTRRFLSNEYLDRYLQLVEAAYNLVIGRP